MKIEKYLFVFLIILQTCNSQTKAKKELYNKDFNWFVTIPENFEEVSAEEWKKIQNKGENAIEDTFGEDIVNQAKTIFVFKNDQYNYFESNYQPFDKSIDGDYIESWKNVNDLIYETLKTQLPSAKITRKSYTEKIDGLEFNVHEMVIVMPNKMVLTGLMYSRLFGKKEFTVSIMFIEQSKGNLILESWRDSKFKR